MAQDSCRLELADEDAQALVFVRAVEEADREGRVLPPATRREKTQTARTNDDALWPARRAKALLPEVVKRWPFVPRLLSLTEPGRGLAVPAVLVAFVVGLSTNALGPDRRIHVLALPLAGILVWNVAVLLVLVLRRVLPVGGLAWRDAGRPIVRLVHHWSRRWADLLPADATGEPELVRRVTAAYLRDWMPVVSPLSAARIRRLLHVSSLALLVGAVGGMYVRGLGFAYLATWESTFVSTGAAQAILGTVLGPASKLTGITVPAAEPIRQAGGDASAAGDAAPWIHLWAVTAFLFAGLPRLVLAAFESVQVARWRRRLPVEVPASYLRRLAAAVSLVVHRIEVLPYSYRLPASTCDSLRGRLLDVFGARSDIRFRSPIEYGREADELDLDAAGSTAWIVVFNLAQTPEAEVHGALLSALGERLGEGGSLLVLVDEGPFRERAPGGGEGEQRRQERRRSWDRVCSAVGLTGVHLDLRQDPEEKILSSIAAARDANDD